MEFFKYQHVERYGNTEVEDIDIGTCYIFPKIDGTNASIYLKDGKLCAGSRNRELSLDKDNAGFLAWASKQENLITFLKQNPNARLFGEWLVPHSLKTYREDAWRKFYVFDVITEDMEGNYSYVSYPEYSPILDRYEIEYIPPLCVIKNPTEELLLKSLSKNQYLIKGGEGSGEGIVIKNYTYRNHYGRVVWAKMVTSEFKDKHSRVMGPPKMEGVQTVEDRICDKYVTKALCDKVYSKIEDFNSKKIPQLLNTVYYDLVREETWEFVKKYKNPKIDFSRLKKLCAAKTKEHLKHLF